MNNIAFRELSVLLSYEDVIFIVGGDTVSTIQPSFGTESTILVFNTTTGRWSVLLTQSSGFNTPSPGRALAAQIIDNFMWIFGGDNTVAGETAMYSLGPLSDMKYGKALIWNRFPVSANFSVYNSRSASVVWNDKLYLYGGQFLNKTSTVNFPPTTIKSWVYTPATNQWKEGIQLPVSDFTAFNAIISPRGQFFSYAGYQGEVGFVNYGFTGQVGEPFKKFSTSPLTLVSRNWPCMVYYNESFMVYSGLFSWDRAASPSEDTFVTYWWNGVDGSPWTTKTTKISSNSANLAIPNWFSVACAAINNTLYVSGSPLQGTTRNTLESVQRYIFALDLNTMEWFDPVERVSSNASAGTVNPPPYVVIAMGIVILVLAILCVTFGVLFWRARATQKAGTSDQIHKAKRNSDQFVVNYRPVSSLNPDNSLVEVVAVNGLNTSHDSTLGSMSSGSNSTSYVEDHVTHIHYQK
ncbi:hypothetical protein HK098_005116 [Nowakowskiella sp. JEL0407]|nr:hypothetical protein HK098_005116 [Nowakowskiella sp. JEL0407]